MLFFFEGGPQSFEHTHFDKGQFMLEAYGEALAVDPGTIDYSRPFSVHLKSTRFHNVITINGKNQSYQDAEQAVIIRSLQEESLYSVLRADLSMSYKELSVYNRLILFVRPDYLLVLDEVDSLEPGLEWNLHSKGSYSKVEVGDRAQAASDEQAESDVEASYTHTYRADARLAGMHVAVVSDQPLTSELATYTNDDKVLSHHLALRTDRTCTRLKLAALLLPYPHETKGGFIQTDIQIQRTNSGAVFTVRGSFGLDQIVCNFDDMRVHVERGEGNMIDV
ncbi:Heparinase II/III-like protein [compost metagenome]